MPQPSRAFVDETPGDSASNKAIAGRRRIALRLELASLAAAAWVYLYPHPYNLSVAALALLPVLAVFIALRSNGRFRLYREPNRAHPSIAVTFILPGLALLLRVSTDFYLAEWKLDLLLSCLITIVLLLAAGAADPFLRRRRAALAAVALFTLPYGYGVATEANCILDHSPATIHRLTVVGKHSFGYHWFTLDLSPLPKGEETSTILVPFSLYLSLRKGAVICEARQPGALGIPWFTIQKCQTGR